MEVIKVKSYGFTTVVSVAGRLYVATPTDNGTYEVVDAGTGAAAVGAPATPAVATAVARHLRRLTRRD